MENKKHTSFVSHLLTATVAILVTALVCFSLFPVLNNLQATSPYTGDASIKNGPEGKKSTEDFGDIWVEFDNKHPLQQIFEGKTDEETYMALAKFLDVYAILKDDYYREMTDEEMLGLMLQGMLEATDSQYTFYLTPEQNAEVAESMSGEYSGIGAIVQAKDGIYQVSDLVDNSPAAGSGLRIGDQFVSIDGKDAMDFVDISQLAAAVRGKEGTTVEIVVFRPADSKEYTFEIERKTIKNANLRSKYLGDGIGYVRIVEFNQGVSKNFKKAVEEQLDEGATDFIVDLRNNPGGYVREVTDILDWILPDGVLATAKGRSGGEEFSEDWTSGKSVGIKEEINFYVLMNEYSASASELFAGCMRDWDRATIIGEQSWGKGVGTISYDLYDGSGIQITNFHYYLPKGESINEVGVTPDIEIEVPEEIRGLSVSQIKEDEDPWLQKAFELIEESR